MTAAASGEVCYQVLPGDLNDFTQQRQNGYAYLGDDVHLGTAQQIGAVTIAFTYFTYDAQPDYTPDLRVDLFDVSSSGIPIDSNTSDTLSYTPIASVTRNDLTFTGSNYNNGGTIRSAQQNVTFDFSGLGLIRQDFAFAYRDENTAPFPSASFFSVITSNAAPVSGASQVGILQASPDNLGATTFTNSGGGGKKDYLEASVTCVPEPSSAGLLALGALAWRIRKPR